MEVIFGGAGRTPFADVSVRLPDVAWFWPFFCLLMVCSWFDRPPYSLIVRWSSTFWDRPKAASSVSSNACAELPPGRLFEKLQLEGKLRWGAPNCRFLISSNLNFPKSKNCMFWGDDCPAFPCAKQVKTYLYTSTPRIFRRFFGFVARAAWWSTAAHWAEAWERWPHMSRRRRVMWKSLRSEPTSHGIWVFPPKTCEEMIRHVYVFSLWSRERVAKHFRVAMHLFCSRKCLSPPPEALLNLSADPNAEDQINETPLHYAAFTGHLDCVKLPLAFQPWQSNWLKNFQLENQPAVSPLFEAIVKERQRLCWVSFWRDAFGCCLRQHCRVLLLSWVNIRMNQIQDKQGSQIRFGASTPHLPRGSKVVWRQEAFVPSWTFGQMNHRPTEALKRRRFGPAAMVFWVLPPQRLGGTAWNWSHHPVSRAKHSV